MPTRTWKFKWVIEHHIARMRRSLRFLQLVLEQPWSALVTLYVFATQVCLICLHRTLLPQWPRYQSFRLQLHRAWWAASSTHYPNLVHLLPITSCPDVRARKVGSSEWTGYLIPGTRVLTEIARSPPISKICVIIYAHGGGYARGEARMYLRFMERWEAKASRNGLNITFLSVEYRELGIILTLPMHPVS